MPPGVVFFGPSTAQAQTPGELAGVPGFAFALMLPVSNGNKQVLEACCAGVLIESLSLVE